MCLAVPGKIQSCEGEEILREGIVEFGTLSKKVNLAFVPEAEAGDYVLVHAGVAITKINETEALRTLNELEGLKG
jgi:hydrogenase expression/formation protein HypC